MNARGFAGWLGVGAVCAGAVLGAGSVAQAAGDREEAEARRLYNEGKRLYDRGDFAGASLKFRQSYSMQDRPVVLLGLALSSLRTGRSLESMGLFRQYMADVRTTSELRQSAQAYFDEAYGKTAHVRVRDEGRGATLNERPAKLMPEENDVEPGAYVVRCASGTSIEVQASVGRISEVDCSAGTSDVSDTEVPASPTEATGGASLLEPGDEAPALQRVPAPGRVPVVATLGGLGAAALGLSVVTMGLGLAERGADADPGKYDTMRTLSTVGFWSGVGLGAAAVGTWFLWPKKTVSTAPSAAWQVHPLVGAGTLGVHGSF